MRRRRVDAHRSKSEFYSVVVAFTALPLRRFVLVGTRSRRESMRSMLITALLFQLGRIYFVPISSSNAFSLVAAPRTVHDEEKHSSIATHLFSVVKPTGVSSSRVGRMHSSTKGWTLVVRSRMLTLWRLQLLRFPVGTWFCWRLVEARIHEVHDVCSPLVAQL
jgi:hypothetical protein